MRLTEVEWQPKTEDMRREGLENNKMTEINVEKALMPKWAHYKTDGILNDSKWTHNTSAVAAA